MLQKKDILFFIVLGIIGSWLLISARAYNKKQMEACIPAKCSQNNIQTKQVSPLNFITRGIFHLPS